MATAETPSKSSGAGGSPSTSKATLGLTGLTINAMALIAPGAFLWLTFQMQSLYGAPMAGCAMWFGILAALLLCFATAISYAELSKLFPGAGSSYFYAEQAFLSKTKAYKFARVAKFFTGWASHLYYWVYPGLHGGCDGDSGGISGEPVLAGHIQRHLQQPAVHVAVLHRVFALGVATSLTGASTAPPASIWPSTSSRSRRCWCSRAWPSPIARSHKQGSVGLAPLQRHTGQLPGRPGERDRRQGQAGPGHLGRQFA